MGGDTDCTNVIEAPVLSVITNVRKDHCGFLGDTLAEIAQHKAGIIKAGCPALTGCKNPETLSVLRKYAENVHAPLYQRSETLSDIRFSLKGTDFVSSSFGNLHLSLLGAYQPENAALVLDAVKLLRKQGIALPDSAVREGLANCRWQGRFEILHDDPFVLFDGAHNPDGMQSAANSLAQYFGTEKPLVFVMSVMADKEYQQYPAMLHDLAAAVFTVRADNPRALAAETLCGVFQAAGIPAKACANAEEALRAALQTGKPVMGLGSLYLFRDFSQAAARVFPKDLHFSV
jgi:dihydrofolate synthase/folylpolyglutamate synthase